MRPSFETAASRPPQDEVQLVETQQPHAEERATRASRSMDSKRLTYLPWSVLALYPGPGERGLRFTAVHIDVLARHLAAGITVTTSSIPTLAVNGAPPGSLSASTMVHSNTQ